MAKIATVVLAVILSGAAPAAAAKQHARSGRLGHWGVGRILDFKWLRPAAPETGGELRHGLQELRDKNPAIDAALTKAEAIESAAKDGPTSESQAAQSQTYDQAGQPAGRESEAGPAVAAPSVDAVAAPPVEAIPVLLKRAIIKDFNENPKKYLAALEKGAKRAAEDDRTSNSRYQEAASAGFIVAMISGFGALLMAKFDAQQLLLPAIFAVSTFFTIVMALQARIAHMRAAEKDSLAARLRHTIEDLPN